MFVPVFPLELVVFPDEVLSLHIFEPRYKQMIQECYTQETPFGILTYHQKEVSTIGTLMRIQQKVKEYADGTLDIICVGIQAFEVERFQTEVPNKLYYGANITLTNNDTTENYLEREKLIQLLLRFHTLLRSGYNLERQEKQSLAFKVAHVAGLNTEQKLTLLALTEETERQKMLIQNLEKTLLVLEATEQTRAKVQQNGHFKILPSIKNIDFK